MDTYFIPYTKIGVKIDQIPKCKIVKLSTKKHRKKSLDLGFSDGFLDVTPKVQAPKQKTDKMDFIKIKKICAQRTLSRKGKDKPQN